MPPERFAVAVARVLRDARPEDEVHFHAGDHGRPYVCHDLQCSSPHYRPESD